MSKKTVVRLVRGLQFVGTDESGHSVVLSGDDKNGGPRPSPMLLVALSACSAVDVVTILSKQRMPVSRLEVEAEGEQDPDPPWTYHTIRLRYRLQGQGLTERAVSRAIRLSEEKYCSVAATIRGKAKITTEFVIE
jgi:putative redox protein